LAPACAQRCAGELVGRFPGDFVFELTREGILGISQTVISLSKLKCSKSVHAYTEHGAPMAANVLNSPRAIPMSVYLIGRQTASTGPRYLWPRHNARASAATVPPAMP
jgi:hypothetical protein